MMERYDFESADTTKSESLDSFSRELLNNALASIADGMALTVARTARSFVIKEAMDYSTALFLANGELIAQGTCLPLHLGSMPSAIRAIFRQFGNDIVPGDTFALNDPYDGGSHLPDIIVVKPVFDSARLIGFSAVLAHHVDIGGRVAGGNASDSSEVYQEGLRIPPVKLYDAGVANDAVFRIIERNVRVPKAVMGDLDAELAACNIGERELLKLARKYGTDRFEAICFDLLAYTERLTRAEISKLPDGEYGYEDYIDDDGLDPDQVKIAVKITIDGDAITVDFAGSSKQVRGAINSVLAFTASTAWACLRSVFDDSIPNNAGYFRPIKVIAPEGTIVNPRPPAAVAARGLTGFRIADTVLGALSKVLPDMIPASGSSSPEAGISMGGLDQDGNPFVFMEFLVGSWGGGPDRDGMDGCTGIVVNYSNTPVEMVEADLPIRIERYAFVPDSGGAGKFRGGLAIERHVRFFGQEACLQVRSDRRSTNPYGLDGGEPGASSMVSIVRAGGDEEVMPSKFFTRLETDDLLKVQLAGGGGFGDPDSRAADAIFADFRDGKISRGIA